VVYQIDADCRRLLYVVKDRTEQSLRGFFSTIPSSAVSGLKFICTNIWRHYMTVTAEKASGSMHIFDRFRVMKKFNEKIHPGAAEESRRLKSEGREEALKHSRNCLLKRPANLTAMQTVSLKELLQHNAASATVYANSHAQPYNWYRCAITLKTAKREGLSDA